MAAATIRSVAERAERFTRCCPECGQLAIASRFVEELVDDRPVPVLVDGQVRAVLIDTHWCNTEGCKHNLDTGEPWGSGFPYD
jgi:hypothetical protein